MIIDPRTLLPVTVACDCHLIPDCFGVSNRSVQLDRDFDNKIGEQCDSQLKLFFDMLVGDHLKGKFAFNGGSQSMAGTLHPLTQSYSIKQRIPRKTWKKKLWTPKDWCRKAIGMNEDGEVRIDGFATPSIDLLRARLSMVNSALLILYFLQRTEIYSSAFDQARSLLNMACDGKLSGDALPAVEQLTPVFGRVQISRQKAVGFNDFNLADLRRCFDPSVDAGDGVMDNFPDNCVTECGGYLLVRLPYGKALRGEVRFPLADGSKVTAAAQIQSEVQCRLEEKA